MNFLRLLSVVITAFFCNPLISQNQELSCREIVEKSLHHIKEVKGLKYHLKVVERGKKGQYNHYESNVKFIRKPRQIYLYIKGIEVLWLQGKNNGRALVKPNSFPYFNLLLDPMGDLMRQDQHHTLHEMGFDYFAGIIKHTMDKLGPRFDEYFSLAGVERMNNRTCYKIEINNRDFAWVNYRIERGESITSIARKFHIPEYLILEKNKNFDDYFEILKEGQMISIPNWYARKVTVFIDHLYFVPISIKVEDDRGLFEEYNYHFLQVNPDFDPAEFTRNYKDYDF